MSTFSTETDELSPLSPELEELRQKIFGDPVYVYLDLVPANQLEVETIEEEIEEARQEWEQMSEPEKMGAYTMCQVQMEHIKKYQSRQEL